jgi:hypothetical protein
VYEFQDRAKLLGRRAHQGGVCKEVGAEKVLVSMR